MTFAQRLAEAQQRFGPICVGADPHESILRDWGLEASPAGLASFCDILIEAFAGQVASTKPQVAFFERYGSAGMAQLERYMQAMREAGTLVIADAKRGDIGSTMAGYAAAWLGDGPLAADAVTLSPYLGVDSLRPAFELAKDNDRGVFVLAVTSNPEGSQVQGSGQPAIAAHIVDELGRWNRELWPGMTGSVGAVIGATAEARLASWGVDIDVLCGTVLAPGVGAQGAKVDQALRVGGANVTCIPLSRAILQAGPRISDMRQVWHVWSFAKDGA
ncbi:MAG: orotidine-5'-phosphate decarboxylase [Flaviflexus sp.]|nr:orotidine-5'-phosphate decarboxylase [Flaviflexus sp.]